MKGKKFQKYANIHQQFKPLPPQPLKKLNGIKTSSLNTGKELPYLQLEKVIGISSRNNSSIAVNPINGEIATIAGCIICIYSPKENKQTKFLFSRQQRSFSCITFSHNGRYLAAGEGAFRQPEITIWEVSIDTKEYTEIKHLKGHKYGIESIAFSPNLCYLISLGDANDRGLFVWDWENEQRITSNKLGKPVNTFAFSQNGDYFVTAGYQHLKYWYFDDNGKVQKTETNNSKESIMESKTADLTKVQVKIFVGVACHNQLVYALSQDGHLYVYDKMRSLKKWMNIKVDKAYTCAISNGMIYCGCSDGFIRVFVADTLSHKVTFPKPPPLGAANIESGAKKIRIPSSKDSKFADITSISIDDQNKRAVVLYSDRMMFIWDIKEMEKITVFKSNLFHCGPIHDLQYVPNSIELGYKDVNSQVNLQEESALTRFMTCSSDRTIRFWHFIDPTIPLQQQASIQSGLIRNAYCKDMSRMIYVNSENRDHTVGQFDHFKVRSNRLNEDGTLLDQATLSPDEKDIEQQVRCVRISPDGKHVACGDWTGNIRVHDVKTLDEIQCIQAHESEVLCLDYSPIIDLTGGNGGNSQSNISDNQQQPQQLQLTSSIKYWLASGSRDRLTQIYELSQESGNYENVTILEDHSSTLTSLKFAEETSTKNQKRLKLISTGADKQIVLRNIDLNIVQQNDVKKLQNIPTDDYLVVQKKEQCKYKSFCMEIAQQAGYIVTGHDRFIQMFALSTCDKVMEKRIESSRKSGSLDQIKVLTDPYAGVVISSSTDKYVTVYEAATGNVICRTTCGEITTALCLSSNFRHLITTSTDGIIYIWRLPENLTKALQTLKQEQRKKIQEAAAVAQQNMLIDDISSIQDSESNRGISIATDINQLQFGGQGIGNMINNDDDFNDLENIAAISGLNNDNIQNKKPNKVPVSNNDPVRMSEVLAQISKAAGLVEKIQLKPPNNIGKEKDEMDNDDKQQNSDNDNDDEKEFDFGNPQPQSQNISQDKQELDQPNSLESSQSNTNVQQRKIWGNKQTQKQNDAVSSQQQQVQDSEEQMRQMKVKENKLPRWAQSVTGDILNDINNSNGDRNTLASRLSKHNQDEQMRSNLDQIKNQLIQQQIQEEQQNLSSNNSQQQQDDIEEVFQNTLDKKQQSQDSQQPPVSGVGMLSHVASQGGGVPKNAFYDRIEEDMDEDKKSVGDQEDEKASQLEEDQEEDEEEKQIKEQLQRRQYQKSRILLGLDDEDDSNQGSNNSNNNNGVKQSRLRMRNNESRTSLSSQFFQRKLGASSEQNLFRGQNLNDMAQIQKQYNQQQQQQQQQKTNKREVLKVEDLFNDDDEDNQAFNKQKKQIGFRNEPLNNSKVLQQSQSQFIQNQGPQLFVKPQEQKQGFTFSKQPQNTDQLTQQQQDFKKLAQEKYEQHKKLLEEEFKKKQLDMEDKLRKEREEMESQLQLRKSQLEIKQKEKLNEMEVGQKPKIQILEEIESEIKKEEERLILGRKRQQESQQQQLTSSHLMVNDNKLNSSRSNQGSRSGSRQRYQQDSQQLHSDNIASNNSKLINEDESIVQIRTAPQGKGQLSKVDEAAINATIKNEMDKINNSLAKITQCLNSTGQATSINNALRVRDDVTESLGRSMGLWNSMMMSLSNRTSINVNLLQSQQMGSSFSQSQSQIYGSSSAVNQSFLSQVSVKDDARDLLQKYSDLLIEEIAKKLQK